MASFSTAPVCVYYCLVALSAHLVFPPLSRQNTGKPNQRLTPFKSPPRGMEINVKPLQLTLVGFIGIFSAFGRDSLVLDLESIPSDAQLVALVGPNGSAKTTILDNLHPYRVMPSSSSTLGPGGFSYWDHINLPNSSKELVWEHAGHRYKSALSFRVSGKTKKGDCYLFQWDAAGSAWAPVRVADGTLSDGKADTYDRCVDAILGPPERFFTSQFSAQRRKTLASYNATDIKSILASVLNIDEYQALSAKAALTSKFLRQQLDSHQVELNETRGSKAAVEQAEAEIVALQLLTEEFAKEEEALSTAVDAAKQAFIHLEVRRDAADRDAKEVVFINEQITSAQMKSATTVQKLNERLIDDRKKVDAEVMAAKSAIAASENKVSTTKVEIARLNVIASQQGVILAAVAKLPEQAVLLEALDAKLTAQQLALNRAESVRSQHRTKVERLANLNAEGQAKTIAIKTLTETASLIAKVPCNGTALQTQCPLLEQANRASQAIPAEQELVAAKRAEYAQTKAEIAVLEAELATFVEIDSIVKALHDERRSLSKEIDGLRQHAAKEPLVVDSATRLPILEGELSEYSKAIDAAKVDLKRALTKLAEISESHANELRACEAALATEVQVFQERLKQLKQPVVEADLERGRASIVLAENVLTASRKRGKESAEKIVEVRAKLSAQRLLTQRHQQVAEAAARLNDELAKWTLLQKGLGKDGCIALSIDDAGPEIASICNALLVDCFSGRFSVRLDTQKETTGGDLRETFEVVVFDAHRGGQKLLQRTSGGEEVLVNECLTRAIALYAAQLSNTSYQTLFTDETDGALDVESKRAFMSMKRAVIERGGYQREYFITHIPELWNLADYKIEVATL